MDEAKSGCSQSALTKNKHMRIVIFGHNSPRQIIIAVDRNCVKPEPSFQTSNSYLFILIQIGTLHTMSFVLLKTLLFGGWAGMKYKNRKGSDTTVATEDDYELGEHSSKSSLRHVCDS